MTEHEFLKWAEDFFVDVEWTPAIRKKLIFMLHNLDMRTHVIEKPEVIIKREIIYISKEEPNPKTRPDLDEIGIDICQKHKITIKELQSRSRKTHLVHARVDFCKLGREAHGYTLNELGHFLGRDHTTIIHYLTNWKHPVPDISKFGYGKGNPGANSGGTEIDPGGTGAEGKDGEDNVCPVGTTDESQIQGSVRGSGETNEQASKKLSKEYSAYLL